MPVTYKYLTMVDGSGGIDIVTIICLTFCFWGTHTCQFSLPKMWLDCWPAPQTYWTMCYKAYCTKYGAQNIVAYIFLSCWQRILKGLKLKLESTFTRVGRRYHMPLHLVCGVTGSEREWQHTRGFSQNVRPAASVQIRPYPWLSRLCLLVRLTLTATVRAVPLCFLSLISPEASSKQTAWWDWIMCLCFLIWYKHELNWSHLHWWTWISG